jgi:hypothetical protein
MKSKNHLNSVISTKGRNLINKGLDSSFDRHESFARTGEVMTNKKTSNFPLRFKKHLPSRSIGRTGVDGFAYIFNQFFLKIYNKKTSHLERF